MLPDQEETRVQLHRAISNLQLARFQHNSASSVSLKPLYAAALLSTATDHIAKSELENALCDVRKAKKLAKGFPELFVIEATLLERLNRLEQALEGYREFLKRSVSDDSLSELRNLTLNRLSKLGCETATSTRQN